MRLYSGKDGSVLRSLVGDSADDTFGKALRNLGDFDGDGIRDLLVGAPQTFATPGGYARLFSGKSGAPLRRGPAMSLRAASAGP